MDTKLILDSLGKVYEELCAKFNVAGGKLVDIMYKQAKFDAYYDIFWIVLSVIIIITSIVLMKKTWKSFNSDSGALSCEDEIVMFIMVLLGVCIAIFSFSIIVNIREVLQISISPEYYIFDEYIKPLIKK